MPVSFEELEGSPVMSGGTRGVTGTRIFKVAWADRIAFYAQLRGTYRTVGGQFVYGQPAKFPGISRLICSDVSVEPFDPAAPLGTALTDVSVNSNTYEAALVTATYTPAPEEEEQEGPEGTIISISRSMSSEYMTTPGRFWKWDVDSTALPEDMNPGLLLVSQDISISWSRVPSPPWSTIRSTVGKVNDAAFQGYPAETLLFLGEADSREFQILEDENSDDERLYRLEYHFKSKHNYGTASPNAAKGWNHFYRQTAASSEHWLKIEDADGNPPFQSADFNDLFVIG